MKKAIIFDLDGCLVDSETLALSAIAAEMRRLGVQDVSISDLGKDVLGIKMSRIAAYVGEKAGQPPPDNFAERIDAELISIYPHALRPIAGAISLLTHLTSEGYQMAVATGCSLSRMRVALSVTGIDRFFGNSVCSTDQVRHGKPAPDIFLLSAEILNRAPHECLVIEDSPHGVKGARTAGMNVLGFVGGSHLNGRQSEHARMLREAGCFEVLDNLPDLEKLVRENAPFLSHV